MHWWIDADDIPPCKRCCECRELQPLTHYTKQKEARDKHASRCKLCTNANSKLLRHLRERYPPPPPNSILGPLIQPNSNQARGRTRRRSAVGAWRRARSPCGSDPRDRTFIPTHGTAVPPSMCPASPEHLARPLDVSAAPYCTWLEVFWRKWFIRE